METTGLPRRTADRTNRAGHAARFPVVSHVSNRPPEEDGAYRQSRAGESLTEPGKARLSVRTNGSGLPHFPQLGLRRARALQAPLPV